MPKDIDGGHKHATVSSKHFSYFSQLVQHKDLNSKQRAVPYLTLLCAPLHIRRQPDALIPVTISLLGDISVNQDIFTCSYRSCQIFQFQGNVCSPQGAVMPPLVEMREGKWGLLPIINEGSCPCCYNNWALSQQAGLQKKSKSCYRADKGSAIFKFFFF